MQNFKKYLPNILTIFRIILIIPIIVLFLLPSNNNYLYETIVFDQSIKLSNNYFAILIIFIFASLTDFLDGFLARKFKVISSFGKFWDPIADKILTITMLIFLAVNNYLSAIIPVLFILRDFITDGIRMQSAKKNIVISANQYGKIKMLFIIFGIIFLMLIGTPDGDNWYRNGFQNIIIYISLLVSFFSTFIYLKNLLSDNKGQIQNAK